MDLTPYVAQLRDDLAAAAAAGDEQTRRTAALLGSAIEPAARLAIMNALSDLASEATAALGDRSVEVRLHGREVRVSVSGSTGEPVDGAAPSAPSTPSEPGPGAGSPFGGFGTGGSAGSGGSPFGADAGDISRVTLRIVEQIKAQAERAAQSQGISLNTWVSQAVQGALAGAEQHGRGPRGGRDDDGRNLRGWVQG
ncbi:toxin-antitoxin system HicB family antitoxin [Pseudonocardia sp. HH130630-07]|uniref:toxin-antitoxin system HicB family antitoxin n=1 Tax=Pseudonocardia sp. HH130630-07 TaxID=1690815 RepID=UPI000814CE0D|nr:toxin-antitoxin system HicB family antitoxin [Pseudonocardia sp. HH130630-07]ANY08391.1 HicB family protein [Pseudonocardia sp. HH130630-07]